MGRSWTRTHVSRLVAHDSRFIAHGPWPMAHGSWLMAHGSWLMAHGSWLMAHGSWLMAHGSWLMAHAHGPLLTATGDHIRYEILNRKTHSRIPLARIRSEPLRFVSNDEGRVLLGIQHDRIYCWSLPDLQLVKSVLLPERWRLNMKDCDLTGKIFWDDYMLIGQTLWQLTPK